MFYDLDNRTISKPTGGLKTIMADKLMTLKCSKCEKETKQELTFESGFADVYSCLNLVMDNKSKRKKVCRATVQINRF